MTREEAIREHRAMWRWIANELERLAPGELYLTSLKRRYMRLKGFKKINANCFLCHYTDELSEDIEIANSCSLCPLQDDLAQQECLGGRFNRARTLVTLGRTKEAAKIAREIAELPEVR